MPITLTRDDVGKRIVATGEGPFRTEEMVQLLDDLRTSGAWSYGVLLDLRRMVGGAALAELRSLRDITEPSGDEWRGPIAIVATVGGLYAMACAYASLSNL